MAGLFVIEAFAVILPSSQFAVFFGLLMSALLLALNPSSTEMNPPNANVLDEKYDFIIVGAGSAGAVVANRLSENPDFKVLLLEAGGDEREISTIPAYAYSTLGTDNEWNYTTEPSLTSCLGMIERACDYPTGRVLGGSSSVNGMLYVRGNKRDYDDWEAAGNYGWSYEQVLNYFKKSEDQKNNIFAEDKKYHSRGGELAVSDLSWSTPLSKIFVEAGKEFGYFEGDYNGINQTVFGYPQYTVENGSRCSTNKAFLVPAGKRKNLHIAKHAHVTKILIDPVTNRAYGVRFFRNGSYHDVLARKEVILSAGALNTPQLLMLSGVGPKDHLKELNITLIKDLPVGFNLQDHLAFPMIFVANLNRQQYNESEQNITYELHRDGPLSRPGLEGVAFLNSKFQDPKDSHPDLMFVLVPSVDGGGNSSDNGSRFSDELIETIFSPLNDKEAFQITVTLNRPEGSGRLLLRSKDPFEMPVLRMNYFENKNDVKRLIDGGRIVLKLAETKSFRNINATYHYVHIPTCPEDVLPPSDEYFECLMKFYTQERLHACGTAKMGPTNDPAAVVNPELKVHGISNLRVIDASIMPLIVSGNTNAPTIMIGERASDLIKKSWMK